MKKLTVLVDLDDTLENLRETWINYMNDKYHTCVEDKDIKCWTISEAFPSVAKEDVYKPLFDRALWERVTPLPGAVEYLKQIIDDGHKVVVVTASHINSLQYKLDCVLFKYFPYINYSDLIITTQKQMIKGDVLIDDAPHNLVGGNYMGILVNAPHNQSFEISVNDNIVRVNTWEEIYSVITRLANS